MTKREILIKKRLQYEKKIKKSKHRKINYVLNIMLIGK